MNTKTKIVTGVVFVGLLVALGISWTKEGKVVERVVEVKETLGAIPGTEISGRDFTVNGVRHIYYHQGMNTGTTTPCSFWPQATSTLVYGAATILDQGTTTVGANLFFSKGSTGANSTTTDLGQIRLSYKTQATVYASTTRTTNVDSAQVFSPTDWINLKMLATSSDAWTSSPTGFCDFEFIAVK